MTERTRKRQRRFARIERAEQRMEHMTVELDRKKRMADIMRARKAVYED